MRERHVTAFLIPQSSGITPARAGKTIYIVFRHDINEDHPRSCGKDGWAEVAGFEDRGSPPLVRERLSPNCYSIRAIGITPARAGKTMASMLAISCSRDHPRSCGKDIYCQESVSRAVGSPPLVRERPLADHIDFAQIGITPARAGKTCRETFGGLSFHGSPPLVRERRQVKVIVIKNHGITPARAGKTPS